MLAVASLPKLRVLDISENEEMEEHELEILLAGLPLLKSLRRVQVGRQPRSMMRRFAEAAPWAVIVASEVYDDSEEGGVEEMGEVAPTTATRWIGIADGPFGC